MNLLLLEDHQFTSPTTAIANLRQSRHICEILKFSPGQRIQLGKINGLMGSGVIDETGQEVTIKDIDLITQPPKNLPLTLILAMPRPQMLKRILQTVATMGAQKLCFLQTGKVEKSFWQSPAASDAAIREQLLLGLEQGMATQLPIVEKHLRFRPFVEDNLATLAANSNRFIAHPGTQQSCPQVSDEKNTCLVVGPEGGFTEKEVAYFVEREFTPVHLGARILKVETAVPVLLAKLFKF